MQEQDHQNPAGETSDTASPQEDQSLEISHSDQLAPVTDTHDHLPTHGKEDGIYTIVIKPRKGWLGLNFQELWYYRELLFFLIWRDMKARYKQTVMGVSWAFVQPFVQMVVFSLIFGRLAEMDSGGIPYPIFMFTGLLPWTLFSYVVNKAGISLVAQASLITKVYFPRIFIPTANAGICVLDFLCAVLVYIGLMTWYLCQGDIITPGVSALLVPVLLLFLCMGALGVGYILASLTIVYRDFRSMITFLIQIWLFLSPVVWSGHLMSYNKQLIMSLNPMFGIIGTFRAVLLPEKFHLYWGPLWVSSAVSVGLFFFGLFMFRRMERRFADVA